MEHVNATLCDFHDDNKTFSSIWTEYDENFSIFYENYLADVKEYGKNHGFLKPNPPRNCYTVSCLPWISFKSFTVHNHGLENYFSLQLKQVNTIKDMKNTSSSFYNSASRNY